MIGNEHIPQIGSYLSGSLSGYYMRDLTSITNLNEEDMPDATSLGVVTCEYENRKASYTSSTNSSTSADDELGKEPWLENVADFTVVAQYETVPMTSGYLDGVPLQLATTAGQPIYDFTTDKWIQRMSWTYNSRNQNFSMMKPLINSTEITLFDKFTIPIGCGLLLPPGYRRLYYIDERDNATQYDQWNFEIVYDPDGQFLPIINAGTKAWLSGQFYDICSWYTYSPSLSGTIDKKYGTFNQMVISKSEVDEFNKNQSIETSKKYWNGDYIQEPLPIDIDGELDIQAINDPDLRLIRNFEQYERGDWNLSNGHGMRW